MAKPISFGLNVDPNTGGLPIAERIAAMADSSGMEYVGVQDHPYNAEHVDTLGLGAGAFADAVTGMGGPRRSTGEARAALSEAIDIIRAGWAGLPYTHHGTHYDLPNVQPGPRPAHDIGLWLGVIGPRAAALVGEKADGWSVSAPYVPPARLPELNDIITTAAQQAGRDPDRITRLYNVMGSISPNNGDDFNGPVERWVDTLSGLYADHHMNTFVFWPSGDRERQSRLFAEQVVPAVRAAVAGSAAR